MNFGEFLNSDLSDLIGPEDAAYLSKVFERYQGFPPIETIWGLMDEQWEALGCDSEVVDSRIDAFYRHPVWLLNGLFIEQHDESLDNRRFFTDWVKRRRPARIADFGGGFGGLARLIGTTLPHTQVEVVDPHPHPAAIALAESTPNVRFVPHLTGKYDLLIATDVFEHVPNPVDLAAETAEYLRIGGEYLMANCFQPVIKCHLPQLFHLDYSWDRVMAAMGLEPGEVVAYGRSYKKHHNQLHLARAQRVEKCAAKINRVVRKLPSGRNLIGRRLVGFLCR